MVCHDVYAKLHFYGLCIESRIDQRGQSDGCVFAGCADESEHLVFNGDCAFGSVCCAS